MSWMIRCRNSGFSEDSSEVLKFLWRSFFKQAINLAESKLQNTVLPVVGSSLKFHSNCFSFTSVKSTLVVQGPTIDLGRFHTWDLGFHSLAHSLQGFPSFQQLRPPPPNLGLWLFKPKKKKSMLSIKFFLSTWHRLKPVLKIKPVENEKLTLLLTLPFKWQPPSRNCPLLPPSVII